MTPKEAAGFRVHAKVVAQELVLDALCSAIRRTSALAVRQGIIDSFPFLQEMKPQIHLEDDLGITPEVAKLMDAEYREALDEVLVRVAEKLKP